MTVSKLIEELESFIPHEEVKVFIDHNGNSYIAAGASIIPINSNN
jgi:hypothetical protein